MNIPKIDLSSLPGLETATGVFGSAMQAASDGGDDTVVAIMVYVYDNVPPEALF